VNRAPFTYPLLALLALAGPVACGDTREDALVHVAAMTITKTTLHDRMTIMAPEHLVPHPPRYTACIAHAETLVPQSIKAQLKEECAQQYQELKQRALNLLISSEWLIGEASHQEIKISEQEIQAHMERRLSRGSVDRPGVRWGVGMRVRGGGSRGTTS
jgi:hypothetical protein